MQQKFVRPVLEEQVIHANGGLIVTRPVGSWLEGLCMYVSVFTYIHAIRPCTSISIYACACTCA